MNVRIKNNAPNSGQRRALAHEVDILLENAEHDIRVKLLHFFRFKRGYGLKRLKALNNDLTEALKGIHARYELAEGDTAWICEKQLEESGINLSKIFEVKNEQISKC